LGNAHTHRIVSALKSTTRNRNEGIGTLDYAHWTCTLDLHTGLCTLDLHTGLAHWTCTLDLHTGLAHWTCTLDLHAFWTSSSIACNNSGVASKQTRLYCVLSRYAYAYRVQNIAHTAAHSTYTSAWCVLCIVVQHIAHTQVHGVYCHAFSNAPDRDQQLRCLPLMSSTIGNLCFAYIPSLHELHRPAFAWLVYFPHGQLRQPP
jgi:hypothetical protein